MVHPGRDLLPGEPLASTIADLGRIDAVVVSHEHYDHCDLDALAGGGFDPGVPVIGPGTVAAIARSKGFRDVRAIEAWETTTAGDLTVTAAPGQHAVHEVTFVIQAGGRTVFFGATRCASRGWTQDPRHYADAVARIGPQIDVRLALPGTAVPVP